MEVVRIIMGRLMGVLSGAAARTGILSKQKQ